MAGKKGLTWPQLNMRSTAAWLGIASVGLAISSSEWFDGDTAALVIAGVWFPFLFWWMLALRMGFRDNRYLGRLQGILVAFATLMLVVLCVALVFVFKTWSYKLRVIVAAAPGAVFLWSWQQQPLDWMSVRRLVSIVTVLQILGNGVYGFINGIEQSSYSIALNFILSYGVVQTVHSLNNDMLKDLLDFELFKASEIGRMRLDRKDTDIKPGDGDTKGD